MEENKMSRYTVILIFSLLIFSCSKPSKEELSELKPVEELLDNNCKEGVKKLRKLAEAGNSQAQMMLGKMYLEYYSHKPCISPDKRLAIKWLEESANQKNNEALNYLGHIYKNGIEIDKDKDKAVYYYKLAVKHNNINGMMSLANMYMIGDGVEKDTNAAFSLYKKASDLGSVDAKLNLAKLYLGAGGYSVDYEEALKYVKYAADAGVEEARNMYVPCLLKSLYSRYKKTNSSSEYYNLAKEYMAANNTSWIGYNAELIEYCHQMALKCLDLSCNGENGTADPKNSQYETNPACKEYVEMKMNIDLDEEAKKFIPKNY